MVHIFKDLDPCCLRIFEIKSYQDLHVKNFCILFQQNHTTVVTQGAVP